MFHFIGDVSVTSNTAYFSIYMLGWRYVHMYYTCKSHFELHGDQIRA